MIIGATYAYGSTGNLISRTNYAGHSIHFEYDLAGCA